MVHSFPKHAAAFLSVKAEVLLRGNGNKKTATAGKGSAMAAYRGTKARRGGKAFVRSDAAGDEPAIRLRRDQAPLSNNCGCK